MAIAGILVAALIIVILEVPSLKKQKMRRELIVFSILLLIGIGLSLVLALRLPVPKLLL